MENKKGLEFQIEKEITETKHFHPDIELIFVLEGKTYVKLNDKEYTLSKEDIILVNSSVPHIIRCNLETIICRIFYSYQMVTEIMKDENSIFFCNSQEDLEHSYKELREIFGELIYHHVRQIHKTECFTNSLLYKMLDCLIENYQLKNNKEGMKQINNDERMQKMIHYVNRNFRSSLSLTELAEQLYVSTSTLSRLFKKQTGVYFADYVNQIRIRYAMNDLLYTDKNITKVAIDSGFSNPSVFNKVFRELYGMTPSDYRNKEKEDVKKKIYEKKILQETLRKELQEKECFEKRLPTAEKFSVKLDAEKSKPYEQNWNRVINIGSVYNLTLANLQYHTLYLTEQLGFSHVRLWNVFSKKLMLNDGKTIGNYNYDNINIVFDFLVSHHIIPFLDFGKRPDTAVYSEGKSVFYDEEYIEFQSRRAWEAMMEDFVVHITKRYGKNEAEKWVFEFSCDRIHGNESHCYQDENYDYFHIFQFAYHTIKRLLPNAEVGGPMGIIHWDQKFLKKFFTDCKENNCIPDFLSFLLFPYVTSNENGSVIYKRTLEEYFETQQITMIHQMMEQVGLQKCKLYITEWNNSVSNRNYLNDSCFRGAYISKKISEIWDTVDLLCIWMGSDWVSNYYDSVGIVNGGSGLLTKDSVKKPVYYAYLFLNSLGEQLIEKGENYIITKSEKQSYHILCFYFKWYSYNYFIREENETEPKKMSDIFEEGKPIELEIIIKNMPSNGRYTIKKHTINQLKGSVLDEWEKFQYENELESSDVKYVREICIPDLSMKRQVADNNVLCIREKLQVHEVSLIEVYED